jgi:hypothetical protein
VTDSCCSTHTVATKILDDTGGRCTGGRATGWAFSLRREAPDQRLGEARPGETGTPGMYQGGACGVVCPYPQELQYTACRSRHNNILSFSSFRIGVCAVI